MRTAIVPSTVLGNDWRAETHCPVAEGDLQAARRAGWNSGALGTQVPRSKYATHGRREIREAFGEAFVAGMRARNKFFKE